MSKDLKLVLKRKWWDMIASGEKKEFDRVTFYLGYSKNRPSITFRLVAILCGQGRPEWGAEPGKEYFVIRLGEKVA